MKRNIGTWLTAAAFGLALTANSALYAHCGKCAADKKSCSDKNVASHCDSKKSIVETAVGAGKFGTLVAAVKAAGLVETLSGKGPFTVFAPTDEAFKKLPEGTVEALLNDLPKLRSILKYHVVSGSYPAEKVVGKKAIKSVLGQKLKVRTEGGVRVGGAKVVATDVYCSNGVIHVIDSVMLPADDIVDTARKAGSFKTLLKAAEIAGLVDALRSSGPLTVFAPTDEAFAALPEGALEQVIQDKEKLAAVLKYHVVAGKWTSEKLANKKKVKTLEGSEIPLTFERLGDKPSLRLHGATVVKADIHTANGTIHVIDRVILPPSCTATAHGN
jgi:uncharacterized surface protein with fasciclin (FAS1) repeats